MRILSIAVFAALAGCAAQPDAPAPAASDAAASVAPAGEQAAALSAAKPAAKPKAFTPPHGYKERLHAGQTVYCTKIVVLGSRFPKEDCRTQAELEYLETQKGSIRGDLERQRSVCGSSVGCGTD